MWRLWWLKRLINKRKTQYINKYIDCIYLSNIIIKYFYVIFLLKNKRIDKHDPHFSCRVLRSVEKRFENVSGVIHNHLGCNWSAVIFNSPELIFLSIATSRGFPIELENIPITYLQYRMCKCLTWRQIDTYGRSFYEITRHCYLSVKRAVFNINNQSIICLTVRP